MTPALQALVHEAQATDRLKGLPSQHFVAGISRPSLDGATMDTVVETLDSGKRLKGLEALRSYCRTKSVAARI